MDRKVFGNTSFPSNGVVDAVSDSRSFVNEPIALRNEDAQLFDISGWKIGLWSDTG